MSLLPVRSDVRQCVCTLSASISTSEPWFAGRRKGASVVSPRPLVFFDLEESADLENRYPSTIIHSLAG
jgi:hypothetical protein